MPWANAPNNSPAVACPATVMKLLRGTSTRVAFGVTAHWLQYRRPSAISTPQRNSLGTARLISTACVSNKYCGANSRQWGQRQK